MEIDEIVTQILDVAFEIHREFGPGLLESVYEALLFARLNEIGLIVQKQVPIAIQYKDLNISKAFIADLIIESKVLIELKSCEKLEKVHFKQVLTYLRLSDLAIGLLINFNESLLKNGLKRIIN